MDEAKLHKLEAELLSSAEENNPQLFADILNEFVSIVEPGEKAKDFFLRLNIGPEDNIREWLKGNLTNPKKRLAPKNLINILAVLVWFYPFLRSQEAVEAFCKLVPQNVYEETIKVTAYRAFASIANSRPRQSHELCEVEAWKKNFVETSSYRTILNKVFKSDQESKAVILKGNSGFGKTTILKELRDHSDIDNKFGDTVLYESLFRGTHEFILKSWLKQLSKYTNIRNLTFEQAKDQIRYELKGVRSLILLDDVPNAEELQHGGYLELADRREGSIYVIATTNFTNEINDYVARIMKEESVEVRGFTNEEAIKLYQKRTGRIPSAAEVEEIIKINEKCTGIPSKLNRCFNFSDLYEARKKLESGEILYPNEMDNLFLNMPAKLKRLYTSLASLPLHYKYSVESIALLSYHQQLPTLSERVCNSIVGIFQKLIRSKKLTHTQKGSKNKKPLIDESTLENTNNALEEMLLYMTGFDDGGEGLTYQPDIFSHAKQMADKYPQSEKAISEEDYLKKAVKYKLYTSVKEQAKDYISQHFCPRPSLRSKYETKRNWAQIIFSWLFYPNRVTEWEKLRNHSLNFTPEEYTYAYYRSQLKRPLVYFNWFLLIAIIFVFLTKIWWLMFITSLIVLAYFFGVLYIDELIWDYIFSLPLGRNSRKHSK